MTPLFTRTTLQLGVLAALGAAGIASAPAARAADGADAAAAIASVQTVNVTAKVAQDAASVAPSKASLDAVQPESIIDQSYISQNASASSNYTDIVNIAPSVVSIDPNGPGLMESQSLTIRGFQDGQYNVTFDGIPWGDSNDFTHHSTVYFMSQDMGRVAVDRGPGEASDIGPATFGGTISVDSKAIAARRQVSAYGSYGSWNTGLLGAEYDSGTNAQDPTAARFLVDGKLLHSDGFLTHSPQSRQNLFAKLVKPLGDHTELSAVAMLNHTLQHVPNGSTPAQQQQYGYNFGLVNDPTSQANSAWNYDQLNSDFEYLGLNSRQGDWRIDDKVYTYAYRHGGYYGLNPGVVTGTDGGTQVGSTLYPNDVPGSRMWNNYRSVGNLLRVARPFGADELKFGLWFDHQNNQRFQQEIDWTQNMAPNVLPADIGKSGTSIDRQMSDTLTSIQPYLQYTWQPLDPLTVTPGLKYASFRRTLNAAVNQKTGQPYEGSHTWSEPLPSIDAHYRITPNLSAYAQFARGFLAPNLNVFYKSAVNLDTVKPTRTNNYQIGANWVSHGLTLAVDAYRITSTNLATAVACPSGVTGACFNTTAGTMFHGGEAEATYLIGEGLSVYGNVAFNGYKNSDGSVLQNSPKHNAALGLIYQQGNLYASLMSKYVGSRYSNVDANGNDLWFKSYTVANLNMSYTLPKSLVGAHATQVGFKVNNLFDRRGNYESSSSDDQGNPLYYVIPTRSFQVNASTTF